jgi:hypothetical protein
MFADSVGVSEKNISTILLGTIVLLISGIMIIPLGDLSFTTKSKMFYQYSQQLQQPHHIDPHGHV